MTFPSKFVVFLMFIFFGFLNVQAIKTLFRFLKCIYLSKILNVKVKKFSKT